MSVPPKYESSGFIEAQYEPGSRGRVLRNKLGIKGKREMDRVEGEAKEAALRKLAGMYSAKHKFTAKDVCRIHEVWLGGIYGWAGKYRNVNVSKGDFAFASAAQVPRLMQEFEQGALGEFTPCNFKSLEDVAKAIATVHVELVLVHPFREGNGRTARLLADLMALQADLPPLDFWDIKGKKREEYFRAVREGMDRNYTPMAAIFSGVLKRSLT